MAMFPSSHAEDIGGGIVYSTSWISLCCEAVSVSQVSGIQVVYNMEAPPGSRVCSLKTLGEDGRTWTELDDERSYPMVAGMYIANGGDGHTCLSNNK